MPPISPHTLPCKIYAHARHVLPKQLLPFLRHVPDGHRRRRRRQPIVRLPPYSHALRSLRPSPLRTNPPLRTPVRTVRTVGGEIDLNRIACNSTTPLRFLPLVSPPLSSICSAPHPSLPCCCCCVAFLEGCVSINTFLGKYFYCYHPNFPFHINCTNSRVRVSRFSNSFISKLQLP